MFLWQQFYTWAQDAAVSAAEKLFQGSGTPLHVNVCASALHLMSQILNWEFQGTLIRGAGGVIVVGKNRASAFTSSFSKDGGGRRAGEHGSLVQVWCSILVLFFSAAAMYEHLRGLA